jgi:putative NADH-flavin reductase
MAKYNIEPVDYTEKHIRLINNRDYWQYYATTSREEAKKVKQLAKQKHYLSYISPASDFIKEKHPDTNFIVWVTSKWGKK